MPHRLFKKKATYEELKDLEKHLQRSISQLHSQDHHLENRMRMFTRIAMTLSPLSREFSELQGQFEEFKALFKKESPVQQEAKISEQQQLEKPIALAPPLPSQNRPMHMAPHEQKGLILIGKLLDEARSQEIPVGALTSNLYPDRAVRTSKTTVSNILKKLVDMGLITRQRRGNYWFISLTAKGYDMIKNLLQQNPLKNLERVYEGV